MNVLTVIRNHGGPIYFGIQGLLGLGLVSGGVGAVFEKAASLPFHSGGLAATAGAMALLAYLRRTITSRLREAGIAEEERRKLTDTDLMTGASVRKVFMDALAESTGTLSRPRHAMLLLVDLDNFKELNDSFGHHFGDLALSHLVECIRQCFPDCLVGRLGGDEFGIIMHGNDMLICQKRAARLLSMLRKGKAYEGNQIPLSASMGIAMAPDHASVSKELFLLADMALYESKSAGRGRTTIFDGQMLSEKRHRRFLERELRAAIFLNELELHYQPVRNADGSIYGLEALVRWQHPARGMISPGDFIPIAERSSLIETLGEWVFKRACLDAAGLPGSRIAINISSEQLKREEIVAMMERVLAESGQSADRFVLEITETVATQATAEVIARLHALRRMGFKIALDDFGTGNCGFNYIKSLPIDIIKIDRSYIRNLGSDRIAQVFVSALTEIARIQGLSIIAEGIESETEFELARAAGCNQFQGFYLGRPEPVRAQAAKLAPGHNVIRLKKSA
ncbi:MAG TPA: bifunctional diguanylate cyclase/phosphodiesterase [Rhizobiaceae bacterium]|nr:bifunctional diguanylate cyclase/phosphodiesterase [Rhizobiaceae bacterium]